MSFIKKVCLPSSQEGLLESDCSAVCLVLENLLWARQSDTRAGGPNVSVGIRRPSVCAHVSVCVCACVYVCVPRASVYMYMSVYAASKEIEIMTQSLAM